MVISVVMGFLGLKYMMYMMPIYLHTYVMVSMVMLMMFSIMFSSREIWSRDCNACP